MAISLQKVASVVSVLMASAVALQGRGSMSTLWLIALTPWLLGQLLSRESRRGTAKGVQRWFSIVAGEQTKKRSIAALVFLPAFWFFSINGKTLGLTSYDNLGVNFTASSLLTYGTADLTSLLAKRENSPGAVHSQYPYSVTKTKRGYFSAYPYGEALFTIPFFTVAKVAGADINDEIVQWRLAKVLAALQAAAIVVFFYSVAAALAGRAAGLLMSLLLVVGSVFSTTLSHGLWSQTGVVFWMVLALFFQMKKAVPLCRWPLLQGACFTMMFVCRLPSAVLILPLAIWAGRKSLKDLAWIAAGAIVAFLPWAAFHYWAFANPWGPQLNQASGFSPPADYLANLAGILFSPARGLFVYQPWLWLLPLVGLALKFKQVPKNETTPAAFANYQFSFAAAIFFQVALISTWSAWTGGHCWGSRLLAEVVPLAAFLSLPLAQRVCESRHAVALAVAIALVSFFPHANVLFGSADRWDEHPAILNTPHEKRVWDWAEAPFFYPYSFANGVVPIERAPLVK